MSFPRCASLPDSGHPPIVTHCNAPDWLDNALDRRAYLEICWANSQTTERFDFKHLIEDDNRVFVTYEASNSGGKRFRNTEILTFRDNRIVSVEVYFGWNLPHEVPVGS